MVLPNTNVLTKNNFQVSNVKNHDKQLFFYSKQDKGTHEANFIACFILSVQNMFMKYQIRYENDKVNLRYEAMIISLNGNEVI